MSNIIPGPLVQPGLAAPANTLPEYSAGNPALTETSVAAGGNFFIFSNPGRNDYPTQNLLFSQNIESEN